MKLSKLLGFLTFVLGLVVMIGPWTFARACYDNEMAAGTLVCHTTRLYALIGGIVMLLIAIILFKVKNFYVAKIMTFLLMALGIAMILLPIAIAPVCKAPSMACRTLMLPFLMVAGGVVTLLGLLFLVKGVKREVPKDTKDDNPETTGKLAEEQAAEELPPLNPPVEDTTPSGRFG
ncbi:MAG: DUF4418 family protein [Mogibacterium sp.]|nr:DUF4418 family protein [Mogibacterium sp.]